VAQTKLGPLAKSLSNVWKSHISQDCDRQPRAFCTGRKPGTELGARVNSGGSRPTRPQDSPRFVTQQAGRRRVRKAAPHPCWRHFLSSLPSQPPDGVSRDSKDAQDFPRSRKLYNTGKTKLRVLGILTIRALIFYISVGKFRTSVVKVQASQPIF
jgi:hypothetical protein